MNKQQLASKIWESANKMRSKIEANEYKDYILGFIFYKFLSDKEEKILRENDFTENDIKNLTEDDSETVKFVQDKVGYFIAYKDLFSTWLAKGSDFSVSDVTDALSAFTRLINPNHKKVFDGIFKTLETGLSKLGDSSGTQTKAISGLIHLIKDIPMDGRQDYDVLGFIYEYLISNFAANAGKKAGEFYTPHEVSILMSEIVAHHLRNNKTIEIYDPTSGSGSLLINIGRSVAKHIDDANNIKYYAQELKENTYNLTRMNLVMRGIIPDNIYTRNGDTLEEDWPYFEENKPETYRPLYVDAVVSNPPYSQKWDPTDKDNDPRYSRYGLAPKGKADYAFLLHDLYHLKPDGIMTIVLPHGVLFRGNSEGDIRANLIENNNIDTIIGLPPNIFFGTSISTIIMVLKQKRTNTDVLIIDASKGFEKVDKNNKLRASDIKKIVDTIVNRETIPKYSKVVSREDIRKQDYNLNIPRYVDSSETPESWDIYSSMFGGIPNSEIDELKEYWNTFPSLKSHLFKAISEEYSDINVENIENEILENSDVKRYITEFYSRFETFRKSLKELLIDKAEEINIQKTKNIISEDIFERLKNIKLIDKYQAYQILDEHWSGKIDTDLEIIQTEGFGATKQVDPNIVIKKKDNKEVEVQEGWIGHIMPFDLAQKIYLNKDLIQIQKKENRLNEIIFMYEEIIDSLSEEEKESTILNDSNEAFVSAELTKKVKEILADIETSETKILNKYLSLTKKADKLSFIECNSKNVDWTLMDMAKDGTYNKSTVNEYIMTLKKNYTFDTDSFEYKLIKADKLMIEEKMLKSKIKIENEELHIKTKEFIESLTQEQIIELLKQKWIETLAANLEQLPYEIIQNLTSKVLYLSKKYVVTYSDIENQIRETEKQLVPLIEELEGNEYDMKGLEQLKKLLGGCVDA